MDELLKTDNLAILALAAWVVFLIKDRAVERAEKAEILKLYRDKIAALEQVSKALRAIRYALQMDQTGEFEVRTLKEP